MYTPNDSPIWYRHFLLGLGSHRIELSGKESRHFLGHLHVLLLQLLDVLHQLEDAGCLWGNKTGETAVSLSHLLSRIASMLGE